MPKTAFVYWYDTLQNKVLSAIDNVVATPFNNWEFIWSIENHKTSPEVEHPYPNVNASPNAMLYKGSVVVIAALGVFFSVVIACYQKLRREEGSSHYFFFECLFHLIEKNKLEETLGKCSIPYGYLRAAAYFYNPDVPSIVLWARRRLAVLTKQSAFKNLEKYLQSEGKQLNKTKEELLEEIYKKINEKLALFITKQKKYGEWYSEQSQNRKWLIKPSEDYFESWQKRRSALKRKSASSTRIDLNKETVFSRIFCFIEARLGELGKASFVYWIGVFIFYFLPGVAIMGVVVWPPVLIAALFLVSLWVTKGYKARAAKKANLIDGKESKKQVAVEFLTEAVKHQLQLDALLKQEVTSGTLKYKKVKFRERSEGQSGRQESKLFKEIGAVLQRKKDFREARAFFNGFVMGCFTIFFSFWLLTAALALVVTLNSIAVALLTLGLGLAYGIYSAIRYCKNDMETILYTEAKFAKLEESYGNIDIPDISLRECDRLFRRGITNPSAWSGMKQVCKRLWTGFIRFGTGILLLKLLPLGTTMAVLGGLGIIVSVPVVSTLAIMFAGGLLFACWHIWQYNCERKEDQTGRIMDFLLNRPYSLESDWPSIVSENANEPGKSPPHTPDELHGNERAFNLLFYGNGHFPMHQSQIAFPNERKYLRKISSSEACLVDKVTAETNNITGLQVLVRKRSNTLPLNIDGYVWKKQTAESEPIVSLPYVSSQLNIKS
ncbi:MAG: hypothetical protein V4471_05780 [Pseudomonadota bacterium]